MRQECVVIDGEGARDARYPREQVEWHVMDYLSGMFTYILFSYRVSFCFSYSSDGYPFLSSMN